jgi:3-methyladenine DNA glycosylase AlkC
MKEKLNRQKLQNKLNEITKTETALSGANKNNHPRNTHRIWLPKYGSQSETAIIT